MRENIVLIGFMGSGKSTIASLLAAALGREMIDSDSYIESREGMSIDSIFKERGEGYFRALEREFIESFSHHKGLIISTGGGMPIHNDTKNLGIRFYLKSDFETINKRILAISANKRPLFSDIQKAKKLYNERLKIYEKESDHTIDATQKEDMVVKEILGVLETRF